MYYVEKTKVLISSVVAMQLICIFVFFEYAKSKFSYDVAQMYIKEKLLNNLSIFRAELRI